MRILHTSDWHLGATLHSASRQPEHDAFLGWLIETLQEREIDVLLIAGDIFHTMNPPTDATSSYYRFLAQASRIPTLRQVVVVGGNHDSPSRLDAPKAVLNALDVHVVGGWSSNTAARSVVPIADANGDIELIVCAVPFVHEYRLGVRVRGLNDDEIRMSLRREFEALYDDAAKHARALHPTAPIVGMGHLTCHGAAPDDYQSAIHFSRNIGGLTSEIFNPDYAYVALGHIHRMIPVSGDRVRYSGTPIPLSRKEAESPRYVLEVTFEEGDGDPFSEFVDDNPLAAKVHPIEVPRFRPLAFLQGTIEEISAEIRGLTWDTELLPYIIARIDGGERKALAARQLEEAVLHFPEDKRPRLVDVRPSRKAIERRYREKTEAAEPIPTLSELTPEDVFKLLYATKHNNEPPPSDLLNAFRSLVTENET